MIVNPSRKVLRQMGYLTDQRGIINRYMEEQGRWDQHLHNAREMIIQAIDTCRPASIAILGSGWLLDVPLDELCSMVEEIKLVDLVHPVQVRKRVHNMKKVTITESDITGGMIQLVYDWTNIKGSAGSASQLLEQCETLEGFKIDAEMVISLNLMNQLDMLLVDYLKRKTNLPDAHWLGYRRKIQQDHLDFLTGRKSLLITDFKELIYSRNELVESRELIHVDIPHGSIEKEWTWDFDNFGVYHTGKTTQLKVLARIFD
jgi:hypothetical protein